MFDQLVEITDQKAVTTSLIIAEAFDKKHHHVMRTIREIDCSEEFRQSNFGLSSYLNAQNKPQPMYNITRDGFSFLALGFTGSRAAQFKEKFIEAFNDMEKALLEGQGERKQVDMHYHRHPVAPHGLDIKYNLDLTKIIMKPNSVGVSLLERLTGIDMTDIHDLISERGEGAYLSAATGEAELVAAHLYAVLNSGGTSSAKVETDENGVTSIIATTSALIETMKQAGEEKNLPPMTFSPAKLGSIFTHRSYELEHLGWVRALHHRVSGQRYYRYTCLLNSGE